jgi:hypothetical protein
MIDYSASVKLYLIYLINILIDKQYFSSVEQSSQYVKEIESYIENKIEIVAKHKASKNLTFYKKGLQYFYYKRNKRTTWYIFFLK